jgi:hypothetical protein
MKFKPLFTLAIKSCLVIWLCFQLISCMPVIKLIYGLHDPRFVSDSNVIKYYNRLDLEGDIYRLKDYTEDNRKKYRYLGNKMPDVIIFNSAGQLVKFEIDCSSSLDSIVRLSPHDIDKMSTDTKSLQDFVSDSYTLSKEAGEDLMLQHKPVYALKFAEFAGTLNKDFVPDLIDRLKVRDVVEYVLLNMDYTIR